MVSSTKTAQRIHTLDQKKGQADKTPWVLLPLHPAAGAGLTSRAPRVPRFPLAGRTRPAVVHRTDSAPRSTD